MKCELKKTCENKDKKTTKKINKYKNQLTLGYKNLRKKRMKMAENIMKKQKNNNIKNHNVPQSMFFTFFLCLLYIF